MTRLIEMMVALAVGGAIATPRRGGRADRADHIVSGCAMPFTQHG